VNAPVITQEALTTAFTLGLIIQDLEDRPDGRMTPLEADIAREELEEKAKRTATPVEVFHTLRDNTTHVRKDVPLWAFTQWLNDREWPEEQTEKVSHNGFTWIMKLFKGPDGFAVKWVPIENGKIKPQKTVYEVFTFTGIHLS
jgi:hypothetical protein